MGAGVIGRLTWRDIGDGLAFVVALLAVMLGPMIMWCVW